MECLLCGRPLPSPDEDVICLQCSGDTGTSESNYSARRSRPITEEQFEALLSELHGRVRVTQICTAGEP